MLLEAKTMLQNQIKFVVQDKRAGKLAITRIMKFKVISFCTLVVNYWTCSTDMFYKCQLLLCITVQSL